MNRLRTFALLLAGALIAAAAPAWAIDPYEIPTVLPLTGGNAFAGNEEREALEVLQEAVNRGGGVRGRPIRFAIVDSQSNPQIAVQLTGGFVAKHPSVLIGDSAVATCNAMAPQLAGSVLQFCLSPGFAPPADGTSYVIGTPPGVQMAAIAKYALAKHWTRVAVVNQNDATGDSSLKALTDELAKPQNASLHLVAVERFSPGDISIGAQLARVRAANAQAIIAYNSGAPFGVVVHGLHDTGVDLPVFASPGNLSYLELKQLGAYLPRQLFFISGPLPPDTTNIENGPLKATDLAYLAAFRRAHVRPDWGHAIAWDTGAIVIAALRSRGLDATPAQLASYINGLHDLPAIQGIMDFRYGRNPATDWRVLQWEAAQDTWAIVSAPGGAPLKGTR